MLEVLPDSEPADRMRLVWRVVVALVLLTGIVALGTALMEVVAGAGGCDNVVAVAMESGYWVRRVVVPIAAGAAVAAAAAPVIEHVRARRSLPVTAAAATGVIAASAVLWYAGIVLSEIASRLCGQLMYGFDSGSFADYFDSLSYLDTTESAVSAVALGTVVPAVRVWAGLRRGIRPWIVPAVTFVVVATLITAAAALGYSSLRIVFYC